jgi:hypothetical protein
MPPKPHRTSITSSNRCPNPPGFPNYFPQHPTSVTSSLIGCFFHGKLDRSTFGKNYVNNDIVILNGLSLADRPNSGLHWRVTSSYAAIMSTDFGRLTPYSGKLIFLRHALIPQRASSRQMRATSVFSVRSLRIQSHPLTRLLRDSITPTLQFLMILLIGLALTTLSTKSSPDPRPEQPKLSSSSYVSPQ